MSAGNAMNPAMTGNEASNTVSASTQATQQPRGITLPEAGRDDDREQCRDVTLDPGQP